MGEKKNVGEKILKDHYTIPKSQHQKINNILF